MAGAHPKDGADGTLRRHLGLFGKNVFHNYQWHIKLIILIYVNDKIGAPKVLC